MFRCPALFIPIPLSDPILEVVFKKSFEIFKMFLLIGFRFSENNVRLFGKGCMHFVRKFDGYHAVMN